MGWWRSSVQPEVRIEGKYWDELTPEQQAEYKADVLKEYFRDGVDHNYVILTKNGDFKKWRPCQHDDFTYFAQKRFYLIKPPHHDILASWFEEVFDFPFVLEVSDGAVRARRVYGLKASCIQSASPPPSSQSATIVDYPQTQVRQRPPL